MEPYQQRLKVSISVLLANVISQNISIKFAIPYLSIYDLKLLGSGSRILGTTVSIYLYNILCMWVILFTKSIVWNIYVFNICYLRKGVCSCFSSQFLHFFYWVYWQIAFGSNVNKFFIIIQEIEHYVGIYVVKEKFINNKSIKMWHIKKQHMSIFIIFVGFYDAFKTPNYPTILILPLLNSAH